VNRADHPTPRRMIALVATLALALAACGSDEPDLGSTTADGTTPVTVAGDGTDDAGTTATSATDDPGAADEETGSSETSTTSETTPEDTSSTTEEVVEEEVIETPTGPIDVALGPDGLILVEGAGGATTFIDFGTTTAIVLEAVEAAIGPPNEIQEGNTECSNGTAFVARWTDSISLDFNAEDQFLAWTALPGSGLTTMSGIGLGTTRQEVEDSIVVTVEETTLGTEFNSGTAMDGSAGLGGIFDGDAATAVVTDLWAGSICAFR
jgi:hypothetical protein